MPKEIRQITDLNEIEDDGCRWLASLSDHPVVIDDKGTIRFRETKNFFDYDLNQMSVDYQQGRITREDYMQFNRDIGYSLSGYWEILGDELDMIARKQVMEKPINEIEEEVYDQGDVVEQFINLAEAVTAYNPDKDSLPDFEEIIRLLRFAAYFYKENNLKEM